MTPEQEQMLKEVYEFMKTLENSTSINKKVDGAFRERFADLVGLIGSDKVASSENQAVDEGGASTYSVLGVPDGFDERDDDGTTKYYPYWT